jgi:hypothetical protein
LAGTAFGVAACVLLGLGLSRRHELGTAAVAFALLAGVGLKALLGLTLRRSREGESGLDSSERAWDSLLLRLAERHGGRLTVADAMAHADITHTQAERRLEHFCARGVAEHRVSDEGEIVYRFPPQPNLHEPR